MLVFFNGCCEKWSTENAVHSLPRKLNITKEMIFLTLNKVRIERKLVAAFKHNAQRMVPKERHQLARKHIH